MLFISVVCYISHFRSFCIRVAVSSVSGDGECSDPEEEIEEGEGEDDEVGLDGEEGDEDAGEMDEEEIGDEEQEPTTGARPRRMSELQPPSKVNTNDTMNERC